jgi:putative ABC transport system substrate-binding protein
LTLAGAAAAFPRVALAQESAKVPRVAWLSTALPPAYPRAFRQGLEELGYIEGRTIVVEAFTANTTSDFATFAASAVADRFDVIVTYGTPATAAAKNATGTIPIVFTVVSDPVGAGFVASLAQPGSNITGNSNLGVGLVGKHLSIIKDLVPTSTRVAVLSLPTDVNSLAINDQVPMAARAVNLVPVFVDFREDQDFTSQFTRVVATGAEAVYMPAVSYFANANRDLFFDLIVRSKLPSLVVAGVIDGAAIPFAGLVNYAPSARALTRRAASYVDAILRGAKPADLPIELAAVFDFAVNTWMAKQIGVTIPESILAQATVVADYDFRALRGPN